MAAKLNVSIRTLFNSCEKLSKDESNFWRLQKFIRSLETMIEELEGFDNKRFSKKIPEYISRLQALKTKINYTDSSPKVNSMCSKAVHEESSSADEVMREMKQWQNSIAYEYLRNSLYNEENLRQRKVDGGSSDNMGEAVKYYSEAQEKLTEHMLSLTRNLKEQTETANRIIKKDTEIVSRSTSMTDSNINSLNKETEKLDDHSRNAWKCWMWLMVVFVIVIFIGMVLFMKIMKKKKTYYSTK